MTVDAGSLVPRLLLFEKCTIESIRPTEFPTPIRVFGAGGLCDLLDAAAVEIVCDAINGRPGGKASENPGLSLDRLDRRCWRS